MKVIKTPEWFSLLIKKKEDVNVIKNIIISFYEELIEKLLKLKNIAINEENAEELFKKSYMLREKYGLNIEKYSGALNTYNFLGNDNEIKEEIQKTLNEINIFYIENITYNIDIYHIFLKIGSFLLCQNLPPHQKKLIEDVFISYKRIGIDLTEEKKNKLKEIDIRLNDICLEFEMNIQANKNHILANKDQLDGLNETQLARLTKVDKINYKIGVDYPTYQMIMSYCKNEDIRKNLYKEFNHRAFPENIDILSEIRILKNEKAKILGYDNFPQFDIELQMAKSVKNVEDFLKLINEATKEIALEEKELFIDFAKNQIFHDINYEIQPWDISYLYQIYENKYFNIDQEIVSQYFPITHTINKLLNIYCTFFDIDMEIIEYDNNSWKFDENIKIVRVSKKNGETIGDLILDLYPRANKYSHACFLPIISSVLKPFSCTELEELPIAFIIANFNKPTNDHDGLLKYDEVRTFFHEFGHALHGLFGATEYLSQSGTSVDADFVETPSQLFEQWLLNKDIVKSISYHYKTGESLSDEVIKKIINLEFYNIGLFYQGQLNKSLLALELFLYPNKSVSQIREELEEKTVSLTPISELSQYVYSFGHLASSLYGPKYYAYLWSFVYAIDFFTYIKSKNGMLDPKIGAKLKDKVLSKGGSIDSNSLINSFLEREPNINNFYEYIKNR